MKDWYDAIQKVLDDAEMKFVKSKKKELSRVLNKANDLFPIIPTPASEYNIVFDISALSSEEWDWPSSIEALRRLADAAEVLVKAGIPFSIGMSSARYTYLNIKVEESPFVEKLTDKDQIVKQADRILREAQARRAEQKT